MRKLISLLISISLFLSLSATAALAEDEEPFVLQSSTVVDGDTDLSIHPIVELVFSKKIDDLTVLSANKDCFHLQDNNGAVVPLSVLFPDTQVQNLYQSHAFLVPEADLAPNTAYTLTVDRGLADKKDNRLKQSYVIHFTTADDETFAKAKENEDLAKLGENILRYQTALPPAGDAAIAAADDSSAAETETASEDGSIRTVILIAVPLLLALLGFVFYRNLRSSKKDDATAP